MTGKLGRSGRKPQGEKPKQYFNSKMDVALKQRLTDAAMQNGRSLSAEIEQRLVRSFLSRADIEALSALDDERARILGLTKESDR